MRALNLDLVESTNIKKEKRDARRTMDMTFGIKKGKLKQMILVEYRLRKKKAKKRGRPRLKGRPRKK